MNEILNGSYNFLYKDTNINLEKLTNFVNSISLELKQQHIDLGLYSENNNGIKNIYNPINYWNKYNIFIYQNEELYDLLQYIKQIAIEMCDRLNIDYSKQKYHIHGWINRYLGELNEVNKDRLPWHNHGPELDHFHGLLSLQAKDSFTHYRIDGKEMDLTHVDGRVVVLTNYEHSHGKWNGESPRITLPFNIKPARELPPRELGFAPYIPL